MYANTIGEIRKKSRYATAEAAVVIMPIDKLIAKRNIQKKGRTDVQYTRSNQRQKPDRSWLDIISSLTVNCNEISTWRYKLLLLKLRVLYKVNNFKHALVIIIFVLGKIYRSQIIKVVWDKGLFQPHSTIVKATTLFIRFLIHIFNQTMLEFHLGLIIDK